LFEAIRSDSEGERLESVTLVKDSLSFTCQMMKN